MKVPRGIGDADGPPAISFADTTRDEYLNSLPCRVRAGLPMARWLAWRTRLPHEVDLDSGPLFRGCRSPARRSGAFSRQAWPHLPHHRALGGSQPTSGLWPSGSRHLNAMYAGSSFRTMMVTLSASMRSISARTSADAAAWNPACRNAGDGSACRTGRKPRAKPQALRMMTVPCRPHTPGRWPGRSPKYSAQSAGCAVCREPAARDAL